MVAKTREFMLKNLNTKEILKFNNVLECSRVTNIKTMLSITD